MKTFDQVLMNNRITYPEVRVLDENGELKGIFNSRQANAMAREQGLDLIEVSSTANPPVVKIVDYGKFKYEQSKKLQDNIKKNKIPDLKIIKIMPNIEAHDLQVKIKNIIKFITQGDKVKISVEFKGRQIIHQDLGEKHIKTILTNLGENVVVEKPPMLDGRMLLMVLAPKGNK